MMKKLLLLISGLLTASGALAFDNCDRLTTLDEKITCDAVMQGNVRLCDPIKNSDNRVYCESLVAPNSYTCERIKAAGLRATCLSNVRKRQAEALGGPNPQKKYGAPL